MLIEKTKSLETNIADMDAKMYTIKEESDYMKDELRKSQKCKFVSLPL